MANATSLGKGRNVIDGTSATGQPQRPQAQQVPVDDSGVMPIYMNFCRVTGTPEEIILDFALIAGPDRTPTSPVKLTQRIVFNFFTAKRLLMALLFAIQKHERDFGPIETDVNRRMKASGGVAGGGPTPVPVEPQG